MIPVLDVAPSNKLMTFHLEVTRLFKNALSCDFHVGKKI